jgi:hypothetical protein
MSNFGNLQPASRLGRSIVTQVATAQTNASQTTTNFGSQTYQVRVVSTLPIWATIDATATVKPIVQQRFCRLTFLNILP